MYHIFGISCALASRRGLCDIDRVYFRVTYSRVKKFPSPRWAKLDG